MTTNDAQIDILLRRHAQHATRDRVAGHLDADELNAFAEGEVPAAMRSRFISHLADCDDCRKLATQLAMSSGTGSMPAVAQQSTAEVTSWPKKLMALFAPTRLRYAAFALVLLAAATVTFVALRKQGVRRTAETTPQSNNTEIAEVKQPEQAKSQFNANENAIAKSAPAVPQPRQAPNVGLKQGESTVAQNAQSAAPKPVTEAGAGNSGLTTNRAAEPSVADTVPSFAPPPPSETERAQQQNQNREPQTLGGFAGRNKDESANKNFGALDRAQASEVQRSRSGVARTESAANNQPVATARQATDEKSVAKAKEADTVSVTSRNANEVRTDRDASKPAVRKAAPARADSEEASSTRTIGGRKFRRQGHAWIDTKFKSSMAVKSISRGSDEYRALEGDIRSIAEQLGDAIIVWKGKAYHIH